MISRSLETAQKRIEGFNFDARKQVLAYDDVLNAQRLAVYERRRTVLLGTDEEVENEVFRILESNPPLVEVYEKRKAEMGPEPWVALIRRLVLQITDTFWLEHLDSMEYIRRSVSLRAYGQRDPLQEYRKEGSRRFQDMLAAIEDEIRTAIPHVRPADDTRIREEEARVRARMVAASEGSDESATPEPVTKSGPEYGRNDTVTIRNGEERRTMKYKKAEPFIAEGWVIEK